MDPLGWLNGHPIQDPAGQENPGATNPNPTPTSDPPPEIEDSDDTSILIPNATTYLLQDIYESFPLIKNTSNPAPPEIAGPKNPAGIIDLDLNNPPAPTPDPDPDTHNSEMEDSDRESLEARRAQLEREYLMREIDRNKRHNMRNAIRYAARVAVTKAEKKPDQEPKASDRKFRKYGQSGDSEPFDLAMDAVKKRGDKISWVPTRRCQDFRRVPKLKDLCWRILVENAEEIDSLEGTPDVLKETLVSVLFGKGKMSKHVLELYLRPKDEPPPVEVHLSDCSWADEEELMRILQGLNYEKLSVLQLDLSGRCMTDYVMRATLAKSPRSLPSLTTVSLKGAFCLSNDGLHALVSSAPLLTSVNLGQCNHLTSDGIISLAKNLRPVLRELFLDDCQNVDAMQILHALKKLRVMEVLSVARIQSVCDEFVYVLVRACGRHMKELVFTDCEKLTAASMRAIAANCPQLRVLDIQNLVQLDDFAIRHLASGCRSLQKLKLGHNDFSDEAIAAFLEASGGSLTELSLNHIGKVADYTALAISLRSRSLESLNLSFCRKITDAALGLIVDSCSNLRFLKLFGCSQITDDFLRGHSNSHVEIIGLTDQTLLQGLKAPDLM